MGVVDALADRVAESHLRERLAVGRPLADTDLLLSRADETPLPVRDYSREFATQTTLRDHLGKIPDAANPRFIGVIPSGGMRDCLLLLALPSEESDRAC
jgi:hypothetical protein